MGHICWQHGTIWRLQEVALDGDARDVAMVRQSSQHAWHASQSWRNRDWRRKYEHALTILHLACNQSNKGTLMPSNAATD